MAKVVEGHIWYFVYTAMIDPWKGKIVSDSESVLKTLSGGDVNPDDGPDEPLKIDGDVVVLKGEAWVKVPHREDQESGIK